MRASPALSRKRWGGGILLVLLLAALMASPLFRHGGMDHPLRASELRDLCPLLPWPPSSFGIVRKAPSPHDSGSATCEYFDAADQFVLRVTLTSTRQLSRDVPVRPEKAFETWMKEVKASYRDVGPVAGNWAMAGSWNGGKQQSLLFEDRGVLVLLDAMKLDAATLAEHARRVQEMLRAAPEPD